MELELALVTPDASIADRTAVHALMAEYAALPHTVGRWACAEEEIAALPHPYVPPGGALLLARLNGEPMGCGALLLLEQPGWAELKRIYVRPTARGRGVGEALTRALMSHGQRFGASRLLLDTAPELHAARALYARLGFVEVPHYKPGLLPDALCFAWPA